MSLTKIGSIGINTGIQFAGVTTIATLNSSSNVLSVGGTVNFNSDVSIGGSVSIGGTLTYEDVTNIDSVGLITARNGIVVGSGITLSKDGDVFFTGIATGNGSGLTALNASNISSGTVPTARLGSGTASSSTFLRGDSTFQTVNTDLVSDTSPQLGGNLDVNGKNIVFANSGGANDDRIVYGASANYTLFFDGSSGVVQVTDSSAKLRLGGPTVEVVDEANADTMAKFISDGAVELYYDNSKKFETDSIGVKLDDNNHVSFGTGSDFKIHFDGSNSYLDASAGNVYFRGNSNDAMLQLHQNGAVELYHDNTKQCETSANGLAFPDGKGIDFSATADGGSGSVDELLDDYEVGTFTATLTGLGGGTNPTFSAQSSSAGYTRIGGFVHVYGYLFNVNVSSSGSGTICTISGLPFASGPHYYPGSITHDTLLTGCAGGYVQTNNNSPHFIPIADGTTSGKLPATGNTKYIMFTANYYTTA